MNQKLTALLFSRVAVSDGSMGALLSSMGYGTPCPDELAVTEPEVIASIHKAYLDAGADVIIADCFGSTAPVPAHKGKAGQGALFTDAAVRLAKKAVGEKALVACDMGPTGEFMLPVGTHSFEEVYSWFYDQAVAGKAAGADFAYIETQTDLAECRAACLAAKAAGLEAIASFSVSAKGRTLTGASVEACAAALEAAGADAIGLNCSAGPEELVSCVERIRRVTGLPVAVQPNAGLPVTHADGSVTYPFTPEQMEKGMKAILAAGASLIGGCCGTTPAHIRAMRPLADAASVPESVSPAPCLASAREMYDAEQALSCPEKISDPEDAYDADEDTTILVISDREFTPEMVLELSAATKLPLLIEESDPEKTEALLRVYPGRAAVRGECAAYGAYIVK